MKKPSAKNAGLCSEKGCKEPIRALGRCKKHYRELWRKSKPKCSVSGCKETQAHLGHGLCSKHLYREHYAKTEQARLLKRRYGITEEDYVALLKKQKYVCAVCGGENIEVNGFQRSLAVDHCHKENKVRGLLCDYCNRGLGLLKDSVELLERAKQYLLKHS